MRQAPVVAASSRACSAGSTRSVNCLTTGSSWPVAFSASSAEASSAMSAARSPSGVVSGSGEARIDTLHARSPRARMTRSTGSTLSPATGALAVGCPRIRPPAAAPGLVSGRKGCAVVVLTTGYNAPSSDRRTSVRRMHVSSPPSSRDQVPMLSDSRLRQPMRSGRRPAPGRYTPRREGPRRQPPDPGISGRRGRLLVVPADTADLELIPRTRDKRRSGRHRARQRGTPGVPLQIRHPCIEELGRVPVQAIAVTHQKPRSSRPATIVKPARRRPTGTGTTAATGFPCSH